MDLDEEARTARLNILHTIVLTADRTADFQTTTGIRRIVENDGNVDDLLAFFAERMLPVDEIEATDPRSGRGALFVPPGVTVASKS